MAEKLFLYPLWLRIWHAFNAIFILVLIATGLSMQYSNPDYPLIPFNASVVWHNFAGVALSIFYLFYFVTLLFSKNKRHYKIVWKGFMTQLIKQMRYYLIGTFKGEKSPFTVTAEDKFNPIQKLTYVMVMFIVMPVLVITGLALLFPELIVDNVMGFGGTFLTALLHSFVGFVVSIFLFIHLYFCTFGTTVVASFKSMVNGWHQ